MFRAVSSFHGSKLSAAAGTPITFLCPPRPRCVTRLTSLVYLAGTTAHTLTVLKSVGHTTLSAAAAAAATSITVTADPGTGTTPGAIAINDWICIELDNGTYFLTKVTNVASLTLTVSALPTAAAAGRVVWFFGAPGDHTASQTTSRSVPELGSQFTATASTLREFKDVVNGICQTSNLYEPLMLHSDNATVAGEILQASGGHYTN